MNLNDPIGILPYVGASYEEKLSRLSLTHVGDLLYHVPSRYLDFSKNLPIANVQIGEVVTIKGEVTFLKNQYTKSGRKIQIGEIKDSTGSLTVVWFNQPFLVRTIYPGDKLSLAGKIDWFGRTPALVSPEYEKIDMSVHTGRIIPIYPETKGVSSKWLRGRIKYVFENCLAEITDPLPANILQSNALVGLVDALRFIHFPKNLEEIELGRRRLAFDELLALQLASLKRKRLWQKNQVVRKLDIERDAVQKFIGNLPFKLTTTQEKAVKEILNDLGGEVPMNRLLEGDVGSGKTVVAAIASFCTFSNHSKVLVMAPTQILAEQHYQTFKKLFDEYKAKVALVTSQKRTSNIDSADILIGTHSLIHGEKQFKDVSLVIVDEQHKFGVDQRAKLITKSKKHSLAPHMLAMTATPIPRTVALTLYGDQELSILTEMPKGRILPTTWIVPPEKREGAYSWIKERVAKEKTQVYVVCPLIDESEKETLAEVKGAVSEYNKLKTIFKKFKVGLIHGRIKDKDKIITKFREKKLDILVSTPVIEVGMDIPNANIMLIEAADRFGLAQLHQLRGRIGRGESKSYCLLFSESPSQKAQARLHAVKSETSGFKLAEKDLTLRGPGEIFGTKQSGLPELKIANWQSVDLIKQAKEVALILSTRK